VLNEKLIGLLPAAGLGSRLNLPFPKELYPTIESQKYKPVARYMVENLIKAGVKHIIFVINETKHQLIKYFGSGECFNCNFTYVVQDYTSPGQSTSPGLADALVSSYHLIKGKTVLFGMPDTIMYPKNSFQKGLEILESNGEVTLCLFPTKFPEKFGMVSTNKDGIVLKVVDKPKSTKLEYMWGCIIWQPVFTEYLYNKVRVEKLSDFAEILNSAINDNIIMNSVKFKDGEFVDFGTYEQIRAFEESVDSRLI
jgi:glucose-1-phosphate thymidylyltransferase